MEGQRSRRFSETCIGSRNYKSVLQVQIKKNNIWLSWSRIEVEEYFRLNQYDVVFGVDPHC